MPLEIDEAREADLPAVMALMAELGRPAIEAGSDAHRAVYRRFLEDPEARLYVARRDGRVVGAASLVFRPRLNFATREAWIGELIVTAAERSSGVGRALVERCVAAAAERGCHRVRVESGNWRHEAHAFYRALGFEEIGKTFRLDL